MRSTSMLRALALVSLAPALFAATAACSNSTDCEELGSCGPYDGAGAGSSGTGGSGGEGGQGGSGGGPIPGCEDSPIANADVINDECGVFVRNDAPAGGTGAKDKPFKTIGEAVAAAGNKRVYVCGGQTFDEVLDLSGAEVFGGLKCSDESWVYEGGTQAARTIVSPTAEGTAVTITTASATLAGLRVVAAPGTEPGTSSIAVFVSAQNAEIVDSELVAQAGAVGVTGEKPAGTGDEGEDGKQGLIAGCASEAGILGGTAGLKVCQGIDVAGGDGGNGTSSPNGGAGSPGQPQADGGGSPGSGETMSQACTDGMSGNPGNPGTPGTGAVGLGGVSASGLEGGAGTPGATDGQPGRGGGGGGGGNQCGSAGAPGGGGGSGGCGGLPGLGGGAGGSSIALLAFEATLRLERVSLVAGNAGKGGVGGDGQDGGEGGDPGSKGNPIAGGGACDGGKGGLGGRGGSGGGGLGGHSVGLAWIGEAPTLVEVSETFGTPGDGGIGGDGDDTPALVGATGKACKTLNFATEACVTD